MLRIHGIAARENLKEFIEIKHIYPTYFLNLCGGKTFTEIKIRELVIKYLQECIGVN